MGVVDMKTCEVHWRSSGGRGEFEYLPSTSLTGREVVLRLDQFGVDMPAEVFGQTGARQGKPRLRKFDKNNRKKLHLISLVMAIARLPDPAREDKTGAVSWPLEDKNFVVSGTKFEIVDDDGKTAVLRPLNAVIKHAEDRAIDLQARLNSIARDMERIEHIRNVNPPLAEAIEAHWQEVVGGENYISIRKMADEAIAKQAELFGKSNTISFSDAEDLPPTPLEDDISGKEGRILIRLHSSRERDKGFIKKAKALFKSIHGRLFCECCGHDPIQVYGSRGEDRIQAHHKTPVEELLPDTETKPEDLAMVCPNCHDLIHARRPWIAVEEARAMWEAQKSKAAAE